MPVSRKPRRDKEMAAVTHNMKEDRVLEKSLQTLHLEQSYAMKLLQLDHRIVRVNYKRLKEKVSRIKSHLTADEITELKQMESEGKIKPSNTVNLGSAIKIAGAAKRLKLQGPPRAHTSMNLTTDRSSTESVNRPQTINGKLRRSNSVVGVFIDAPEPSNQKRRSSIDNGMTTIRPLSAFENTTQDEMKQKNFKFSRPATSVAVLPHQINQQTPRANPAATHSPYSSHTATEKEKSGMLAQPRPTVDKTSMISDDSIDSNLGEDLMEERRQELLMEENARFQELEERKKEFMSMLDDYFKANPSPNWDTPPPVVRLPEEGRNRK
ncbi:hypothetical protein FSP39_012717 [Pinctada imbricata]|uniref:Uncharacterized protein n=1 Tax=Pinctada imbricata TaxID=66713 RepID=A0AA88YEG0_PINIB|nr:hypothetical protein FSP39_012717 [Pinctada imbricata]